MESKLAGDPRFGGPSRHDRPDGTLLATRWPAADNPRVWFEVAVRPKIPQVRVGLLTDDRWKSEDLEDKIEESGDTMREFVELGFEEAGLTWHDPPVEHFREELRYFYFATPLDLGSPDAMASEETRGKILQMLNGYWEAFGRFVK